ncbi:MAG: hypothetical protein EOP50_20550, partial [Sphingobacteriales bacterium]
MTRTFRFEEDAYARARKLFFTRSVPIMLVAFLVYAWVSLRKDGWQLDFPGIVIALIPLAIFVFGGFRSLQRIRDYYHSFTIEISDNEVTRTQAGQAPLTLHAYDITSIEEHKNGTLLIRGRVPREKILVPPKIGQREELRALLDAMQPITIGIVATPAEKNRVLLTLLRFGCLLATFMVQDRNWLLALAPATAFLLLWHMYELQKSGLSAAQGPA